jgi:hypothetical protein
MSIDLGNLNEDSGCIITCTFTTTTGMPATPTATTYRLDNDTLGTNVVPDGTAFTPPTITITGTQNTLIGNVQNVMRLTVKWTDSATGLLNYTDATYTLLPLRYVP